MKNVTQRYGLMKLVGGFYMSLALALFLGGLILGFGLLLGDFYAEYRRGAHLLFGLGVMALGTLAALGFFVQGSMANAVADIDRNTRVNTLQIEAARDITEKAVRNGQTALKSTEAMLHAQSALQVASQEMRALPSGVQAEALAPAPPQTEPRAEMSGVIGMGGVLMNASDKVESEPTETFGASEPAASIVEPADAELNDATEDTAASAQPVDHSDEVVQSLFARAKGAVVRTRRPWSRDGNASIG